MTLAVLHPSRNANQDARLVSLCNLRQQTARDDWRRGCYWEHLQTLLWSCVSFQSIMMRINVYLPINFIGVPWLFIQISRVLHPRLVHCRQKTDVPLLQGKGWSQENFLQPLGAAARSLRPVAGLDQVAGGLAAAHFVPRPGHQLGSGAWVKHCSPSATILSYYMILSNRTWPTTSWYLPKLKHLAVKFKTNNMQHWVLWLSIFKELTKTAAKSWSFILF